MSYPSILVHLEASRHLAQRVRIAAELAGAHDAHLIGAAMTGLSRFIYPYGGMAAAAPLGSAELELLNDRAGQALAEFDTIVGRHGVQSYEKRLINDEPEAGMVLQARYADLVIVSQSDPDEPSPNLVAALPEYVVLNSVRPVLILPYAGQIAQLGRHALVAWDGSMEATRALTAALPLLRRADKVTLAVFNPSAAYGVHGEQPGADIALYLARHGVTVEIALQVSHLDIGNALLSLAADLNVDLLVMGAYGHNRFREVVLGGATRTVLDTMTVPVLMAH